VGTSNSVPCLFVQDLQSNQAIQASAVASGVTGVAVSANGSRSAVVTSSAITVFSVGDGSVVTNIADTSTHGVLRFSADAQKIVYAHTNIYVWNSQNGITYKLTFDYNDSVSAPNGVSDFPDISANGSWVTFVSSASNLCPGDNNGVPDIFLYDLTSV